VFVVKNCWGNPVPNGVCARKPWSFSSVGLCKNLSWQRPLGADIWSSEKVRLGWVKNWKCTSRSLLLVDQSSPDFFSPNAGGIPVDTLVFRCWISLSVPEIFAIEVWSCPKLTPILHVLAPGFLGGQPPKFWDYKISDYKIEPTSDHVAKFRGDRPTELWDLAVKK